METTHLLLIIGWGIFTSTLTVAQSCPDPAHCTCSTNFAGEIEVISCTNLDAFPPTMPKSVVTVTISASAITIPSGTFVDLENLQRLELHSLDIERISSCAFCNLKGTFDKIILIRDCNIGVIEKGAFSGIEHVYDFKIYQSSIVTIQSGAFLNIHDVYSFKLFYTDIGSIASHAFWHVTNVKNVFEIYDATITHMEPAVFINFTDINRFELWDSAVSNISSNFLHIWNSHTVSLHGLGINSVDSMAFGGVFDIDTVEFYENEIQEVKSNAFSGMAGVQNLVMKDLIFHGDFGPRMFHNDIKTSFKFYNIQIRTLPCRLDLRNDVREVLYQAFNNLLAVCDCSLQWLVNDWTSNVNLIGDSLLSSFQCQGGPVGGQSLTSQDVLDHLWRLQCGDIVMCTEDPIPEIPPVPDLTDLECVAPGGSTWFPLPPIIPEDVIETTTTSVAQVTPTDTGGPNPDGPNPVPGEPDNTFPTWIIVVAGAAGGTGLLIIFIFILCCVCRQGDKPEKEKKHKGPRPLPTPEPQRLMPLALRNLENKNLDIGTPDRTSAATTVYEEINEEHEEDNGKHLKEAGYQGLLKDTDSHERKKGYQSLEKEDMKGNGKTEGYEDVEEHNDYDLEKQPDRSSHSDHNRVRNDYLRMDRGKSKLPLGGGSDSQTRHSQSSYVQPDDDGYLKPNSHTGKENNDDELRDSRGSYVQPDDGYLKPSPNPGKKSQYDNISGLKGNQS